MNKPDWSEWSHTPNVMLWQACALSMNKDPYSMKPRDDLMAATMVFGATPVLFFLEIRYFNNIDEQNEFKKRLRILIKNRDDRNHFPQRRQNLLRTEPSLFWDVALSEFAAWAVSVVKWGNLPPELVALAQRPDLHAGAPVPAPTPAADLGEVEAVTDDDQKVTLINRNRVIGAFAVKPDADENITFWDDKLGRPPKWLEPALAQRGKPGDSSLWLPLMIAHCLLDQRHMNLKQLDAALHKNFPDLYEKWKEDTQDKR